MTEIADFVAKNTDVEFFCSNKYMFCSRKFDFVGKLNRKSRIFLGSLK